MKRRTDEEPDRLIEKPESLLDSRRQLGMSVGRRVTDFQHRCRRRGERFERHHGGRPIDRAIARPQVLILQAMIVVDVNGCDAFAESGNRLGGANGDMGMAKIEAYTDIIQVAHFENQDQMLGVVASLSRFSTSRRTPSGRANAPRCSSAVSASSMVRGDQYRRARQDARRYSDGDVLGGFQRALDLVHGIDAAGLVGVQHIHARRPGAAHLAVGIQRSVH